MTTFSHEFETTLGDELTTKDLAGATWKVVETFADVDDEGDDVTFTHRIELWQTDDQVMAMIPGETLEEKRESVERAMLNDDEEEGS